MQVLELGWFPVPFPLADFYKAIFSTIASTFLVVVAELPFTSLYNETHTCVYGRPRALPDGFIGPKIWEYLITSGETSFLYRNKAGRTRDGVGRFIKRCDPVFWLKCMTISKKTREKHNRGIQNI